MPKKNLMRRVQALAPNATAPVNDDPTLQTRDVTIGGKVYTLCLDLRSLARAERELRANGYDVSLYLALPGQTLDNILTVFAAALRRFHPEIDYDAACNLLTLPDVYVVGEAIMRLWQSSMPKPEKTVAERNPIQPGS